MLPRLVYTLCCDKLKGHRHAKFLLQQKGSVLLVEKLRGTLSYKHCLRGEKFEDLVTKFCHFVINDVIKTTFGSSS